MLMREANMKANTLLSLSIIINYIICFTFIFVKRTSQVCSLPHFNFV